MRGALDLLWEEGGELYGGEPVTQLEHALQAATLAAEAGAEPALVLAALLHDVGHLLHPHAAAASRAGIDARHEELGARFLALRYGPEVVEPVRLHVAAKRLLARDAAYRGSLSEESARTLALQGGPLDDAAAERFLALPFAADALALRRWDEAAKAASGPGTPPLEAWRPLAEKLAR